MSRVFEVAGRLSPPVVVPVRNEACVNGLNAGSDRSSRKVSCGSFGVQKYAQNYEILSKVLRIVLNFDATEGSINGRW